MRVYNTRCLPEPLGVYSLPDIPSAMPAPAPAVPSTDIDGCMNDASDIPRGRAADRALPWLPPEPDPLPFISLWRLPLPPLPPPDPSLSARLRPALGRFWLYACNETLVWDYESKN